MQLASQRSSRLAHAHAARLIRRRFEQRLASGKRCYVAQVEGALAAYGWVSWHEEEIGEIGLRLHLMPGEAYIWDCATAPAYRRLSTLHGAVSSYR